MEKFNFDDLIKAGQLQKEPNIGKDQVARLLKRADKDLKSAAFVKEFDEGMAMEAAYNSMFHAANALLRSHGYRPGPVRQHQGVIAGVSRLLGEEAQVLVAKFDRLRKKRNQFEYQGIDEIGTEELRDALGYAESFCAVIKKALS